METAERWRNQVVDALLLALFVGSAVALPIIMVLFGQVFSAMALVASIGMVVLLLAVVLRRRVPLLWRAVALLAVLFASFAFGVVLAGPYFGPGLTGALFVALAALILGRNAGFVALALCVVTMAIEGVLVTQGVIAAPPVEGGDMSLVSSWIRETVAFGVFTGVLAVSTGFVVRRIERSLAATSAALLVVEAEQAANARARAALSDAERAVAEMQRAEALGRLAGGVAHDFNNALLVVMGGIEVLADSEHSSDAQAVLEDMRLAAEGAAQLTAQLLAYGRRDVVEPRVVQPELVLESTVRALRRLLPEDIDVEVQIDDPPTVLADPRGLEQLLLNLAINARDAMPQGGALTLAAGRHHDGDSTFLRLTVSDTGTGIDPAIRGRIFEPFFTTKQMGDGTGLGLSMVLGIVDRMGGSVQVTSEQGVGTDIEVLIPTTSLAPRQIEAGDASARAAVPFRGTILLAEDDDLVRRAMTDALGRGGFSVVEASSAAEALDVLRALGRPVDLLCTDGIMAGGSSKSLIEGFRELFPDAPVLVCSGYLEEELIRRDIETGSVAFMQKPFPGSELVRRVIGLLA